LLILLFASGLHPASAVDLVINEFEATNNSTVQDEWGDYDDWVEIYNAGTVPVNVEGMFLSDDFIFPTKFELPDTLIPPGGFLVVWCDNEMNEGPLHANFRLDGDGEQIGLFNTLFYGAEPIDTLSFGQQIPDVSWGRYPDGAPTFAFLGTPSPGAPNVEPYNIPPFLTDTERTPINPSSSDEVIVTTEIVEDFGLASSRLYYDPGTGYVELILADDGAHGDGAAGDGLYGGIIPPLPDGTLVYYYVWAMDDSGLVGTDPPGAPAFAFSYEVGYVRPPLYINEFLASNQTTNQDEWGDYDDWVEIYNAGTDTVYLGGRYLTDDLDQPTRFALPDTLIPPGGFLLVWCDGEPTEGPLHANFRLSAAGEQIGIFDSDLHGNVPLDTLTYGPQTADISYGRLPDGADNWVFFDQPTPGESNGPSAVEGPRVGAAGLWLVGVGPNPAPARGWVRFRLGSPERVVLRLVRVDGREVFRRAEGWMPAGTHRLWWTSRQRLASGVYVLEVQAGGQRARERVLVLK
jgi:hypothetical protein